MKINKKRSGNIKRARNKKVYTVKNFLTLMGILGLLVSIVAGSIAIYDKFFGKDYPSLELSYNGKEAKNGEMRDVLICVDDTSDTKQIFEIFPVFKNPSSLTAKEFAMLDTLIHDSITIEPKTQDFNLYEENESISILRYKEPRLPAHSCINEPIKDITLNGIIGKLKVNAFATYEGTPKPYQFGTHAKFIYVDSNGLKYEDWVKKCENAIIKFGEIPYLPYNKKTDVFYSSKEFGKKYKYDLNISVGKNQGIGHGDYNIEATDSEYYEIQELNNILIEEPHFDDTIGILNTFVKEKDKSVDSLVITVYNGFSKDTTLLGMIQFQDKTTDDILPSHLITTLAKGKNELSFNIEKNLRLLTCNFSKKTAAQVYESQDSKDNDSHKMLIIIISFILSLLLFLHSLYLLKRENLNQDLDQELDQDLNQELKQELKQNQDQDLNTIFGDLKDVYIDWIKDDVFIMFIKYLVKQKSCEDPDVLTHYYNHCYTNAYRIAKFREDLKITYNENEVKKYEDLLMKEYNKSKNLSQKEIINKYYDDYQLFFENIWNLFMINKEALQSK